ncbi:hypothetical protein NQZ79_g3307 [Umbelopsis isabellina]|nr:hypothetical protein NQZ79_g3307 [Umbelopsis isabellina]
MLPVELQLLVLDQLYFLDSDNSHRSLTNGTLVCHAYYAHLQPKIYHTLSVSSPQRYNRLLQQLYNMRLVKCLDLSAYTSMGSGWTDAKAKTVVNAESLALLIRSCSQLETLLLADAFGNIIDSIVLSAIFSRPKLSGLDMVACSSPMFAKSMAVTMGNLQTASNQVSESDEPRAYNSGTDPSVPQHLDDDSAMSDHPNKSMCSSPSSSRRGSWDVACSSTATNDDVVTLPPSLVNLSLHMCSSLSESSVLVPLLSSLSALNKVDLSHTKVTTSTLWNIAPNALTDLSLRYCRGLTCCNAGLPYLLARFEKLIYLNLAMDPNLGGSRFCETCLTHIMSNITPQLKTLDISGSLELNDDHLNAIPQDHQLEKLSIAHCRGITLEGVLKLIKRSPKLCYINVAGVTSVEMTLPSLMRLLESQSLAVTEISDQVCNVLPSTMCGWQKSRHGRRCYLSSVTGNAANPEFKHSYKLSIGSDTLSPLAKYWSFAV